MKFLNYSACPKLSPYIRSISVIENEEASTYKVLPRAALVMGFQYSGKLSYLEHGIENPLSLSGITGLRDSFRLFRNLPHTGTILVTFREAGAAAFFKEPMHELLGASISLDLFSKQSEINIVEEKLALALSDAERISIVEKFLLSRLRPHSADPVVLSAIRKIYESNGDIRIAKLAKELCISQSPLEKRFRSIVGASPKKFASIVKLQKIISAADDKKFSDIVYESGYFDQAHFIRAFKHHTGDTPQSFFRSRKKI